MELNQHMSSVEVVDCMKFVVPLLVPHKSPVQQKKVLLVEVYRRLVEQLLEPHKSLVERRAVDYKRFVVRTPVPHSYLVELVVADCKMFVELLLVLRTNLAELRKQMLVVSYKMFVKLQLVLHRSLLEQLVEEHHNQSVVFLLALVAPRKSALAVVSILDWMVLADEQVH